MKLSCELIRDLLPLYHDGVCSPASAQAVEEHLKECEACREEYQKLLASKLPEVNRAEEQRETAAFRKLKRKLALKRVATALLAVLIFAAACTGAGAWMNVATVEVPLDGLIESIEVIDQPEDIVYADINSYFRITFSKDRPEVYRSGVSMAVLPVAQNGREEKCLFISVRETVWDHIFDHSTPDNQNKWNVFEDLPAEWWAEDDGNGKVSPPVTPVDKIYYLSDKGGIRLADASQKELAKLIQEKAVLVWSRKE